MLTSKPWYESRTFWLNAIIVLIAALGYVIELATGSDLPFSEYLDEKLVALLMGIANIVMRFSTTQPIHTDNA